MNENDPLLRELETLIDRHGARAVLEAFSQIAYGKSEHLQSNWQDERSAKNWSRLARKLCGIVDWSREIMSMDDATEYNRDLALRVRDGQVGSGMKHR